MADAVIVAIITGACAILAQLVIAKQNSKDLYAKLDKNSEIADTKLKAELDKVKEVITLRIDSLEKRVDKHNNFGEKIPVIQEQIKTVSGRIDDLERKVG